MSDLAKYVEHHRRVIEMDAETKRLELEAKVQEETTYKVDEGEEEYWATYKDMKVIKAKWDLEFHKLNMYHYIEKWEKENPTLREKFDMKVSEIEVKEVEVEEKTD